MNRKELSETIKAILRERGLCQKDFAATLRMSYQSLNRAVNGRRPIYAEELPRFADALGVSTDRLLSRAAR